MIYDLRFVNESFFRIVIGKRYFFIVSRNKFKVFRGFFCYFLGLIYVRMYIEKYR